MKKILLFLIIAAAFAGCSVPKEEIEKDKTFLKSPGLKYDLVLHWSEPNAVKYLNTQKFIAVWDKTTNFSGYKVRVLFDRLRVVSWKIEEIDMDKALSQGISMSE